MSNIRQEVITDVCVCVCVCDLSSLVQAHPVLDTGSNQFLITTWQVSDPFWWVVGGRGHKYDCYDITSPLMISLKEIYLYFKCSFLHSLSYCLLSLRSALNSWCKTYCKLVYTSSSEWVETANKITGLWSFQESSRPRTCRFFVCFCFYFPETFAVCNMCCKVQWVCVHQRVALYKSYLLLLLLLLSCSA